MNLWKCAVRCASRLRTDSESERPHHVSVDFLTFLLLYRSFLFLISRLLHHCLTIRQQNILQDTTKDDLRVPITFLPAPPFYSFFFTTLHLALSNTLSLPCCSRAHSPFTFFCLFLVTYTFLIQVAHIYINRDSCS